MTGRPELVSEKVACLDWSVVSSDGHLVAYRFDGEPNLSADKLVWV